MFAIELPYSRRQGAAFRFRLIALVVWIALWLGAMCAPRVVWAQSEADRATARNLAAEGYTALKTQDFDTAEDRFRRADALVHAPTLVVDHARALIGLGRYVEAQERLELVMREGVADNAPWVWKKSVRDAEQLVEAVKPKVAWLTINVTGPTNPLVMVDGTQVPVAALGVRRAVDPGARRISASANGYEQKEISVTLPEGGERAVTLELPVDPSAMEAPAPPAKQKAAPQPAPMTKKRSVSPWTYAAFGLGGAGLVVGSVTGIVALGKRSDLREQCHQSLKCTGKAGDPSLSAQYQLADEYRRYGTISGVSFGLGVVSTGIGVWLLLAAKRVETPEQPVAHASVVPYVTNNEVGLTGSF
ncbi:MAG TPA: hypothetical protein VIV60_30635 [Polyangiaceae bacterium]